MYEKLNLPHPLKKSLAFSLAEETTVSASSELPCYAVFIIPSIYL